MTRLLTRRLTGAAYLAIALAIAALAPVDSTQAQDWRFAPGIRVGGEFDDNATLTIRTDEEVELEGTLFDINAKISYDSPTSSFYFDPRLLSRHYPNQPDFESNDYFLRSSYGYEGTANDFGFRLNFNSQATRTAERTDTDLDIDDPDEIPGNDSGRTFLNGKRDTWWLSPYWRYQINDTSSFGVTASFMDATYDEQLVDILNDYTDFRINAAYRHRISSVSNMIYQATARRYNSTDFDSDIQGYGFSIGFESELTQTLRLTALVGFEEANTFAAETDPQVVGGIRLSRNQKTINIWAEYKRSIDASGIRSLSIRDSVSVNFRRRLSDKISAGLGARAYKSRAFGSTSMFDDRDYVQLAAMFSWYLTPTFSFDAEYRYSVMDRQAAFGESSNSNRVNLWFSWRPNL